MWRMGPSGHDIKVSSLLELSQFREMRTGLNLAVPPSAKAREKCGLNDVSMLEP
jgi:hypothetical protein